VLNIGKKEEMKTSPKAKIYAWGFYFTSQGAIECMVRFKIDSRTIRLSLLVTSNDRKTPALSLAHCRLTFQH
jgi:hypothetical protein